MKHYTIEEIDRYVHGEMGVLSKIKCASHLKSCEECRNLLNNVENNDAFINKLKNALEQMDDGNESNAGKTYNRIKRSLQHK